MIRNDIVIMPFLSGRAYFVKLYVLLNAGSIWMSIFECACACADVSGARVCACAHVCMCTLFIFFYLFSHVCK